MNELFKKNLEILEEKHAALAQKLRDFSDDNCNYDTKIVKSGEISFFQKFEGKVKYLTSRVDPRHEAFLQVDNQWLQDGEVYVVLGIGGFYHIEEVLNRIGQESNVFVVSSEMGLFRTILMYRDLRHILGDPRLFLLIDDIIENVYSFFRIAIERDAFDLSKLCIIEHPIECKWNYKFYERCRKRLVDAYRQGLANLSTKLRFGDQWVRNILGNLPTILQSEHLGNLYDAFLGRPAILVSAGPSLNKNIQLLREVKDRALIVCVDTAYRAMQKAGIQPDLLVSIDGSYLNYKHFENIDYSDVPLVMEMSVHEEIVNHHTGPKIILRSMSDFTPWLERVFGDYFEIFQVPTGGSVATSAFSVMKYLGCDPIIFIGQDLSYPEGKAYASDTKFGTRTIEDIKKERNLIPVKDIYGNDIFTTDDYLIYLKWFEEQVGKGDRTYINATEGGALKNGVEILTLREAIDRYCVDSFPINEILSKVSKRTVPHEVIRQGFRKMKQTKAQLMHMEKDLGQISEYISNFLAAYEREHLETIQEVIAKINLLQERVKRYNLGLMFTDAMSYRELFVDIQLEDIQKNNNLSIYEQNLEACKRSLNFTNDMRKVCQRSIDILEQYTEKYYQALCVKSQELERK